MSAVTLIGEELVSDDGMEKYAERVKAEARSLLDSDLKLWHLEVDSKQVKVYTRPVQDTEVSQAWAWAPACWCTLDSQRARGNTCVISPVHRRGSWMTYFPYWKVLYCALMFFPRSIHGVNSRSASACADVP